MNRRGLPKLYPSPKTQHRSRIIDTINALVLPKVEDPNRLLFHAEKLTEILDAVVSDFCDKQRVSSEIAWQLIQGLSDVRLERLRSGSSSE